MTAYKSIMSIVLGSTASTVTFNNIPQTYSDIILVANFGRSAADTGSWFRVNNDSGTNYCTTNISGTGTSAISGKDFSVNVGRYFRSLSNQTTNNSIIMDFMNYANPNIYKTILTRGGTSAGTGSGTEANVNVWRSTSPITSISLITSTGTYSSGSVFNLYGLSKESITTVKASGGDDVYSDGTYWYHVFKNSGTFTPLQSLNVDYLVVAGGGSGGTNIGGGGGAGGARCTVGATGGGGSLESALSLTGNTGYTVTVGAGGAAASAGNNRGNAGSNSVFSTITSIGGGGGGNRNTSNGNGGSPSGGGGYGSSGGGLGAAGTTNQSFAGGNAFISSGSFGSGGGGGTNGTGANGTSTAGGNGGSGITSSISGSSATYAGGGGGGADSGTAGSGGSGGGGAGAVGAGNAVNGTTNTGSGGGGNGTNVLVSGAGGSGIVIVRYPVA